MNPSSDKSVSGSRKAFAILGSAVFAVFAPGTFVVLIPWSMTRWQFHPPMLGLEAIRYLGAALILAGLPVLADSFARFAVQGLGTPAPIFPTKKLIVTGFYRYVRNPMYVSVLSMVVGQGLLFGSLSLLIYGGCAALVIQAFVLLYEEPTMRRSYGEQYAAYCAHVRRWLPRLTPWRDGV